MRYKTNIQVEQQDDLVSCGVHATRNLLHYMGERAGSKRRLKEILKVDRHGGTYPSSILTHLRGKGFDCRLCIGFRRRLNRLPLEPWQALLSIVWAGTELHWIVVTADKRVLDSLCTRAHPLANCEHRFTGLNWLVNG